MRYTLRAATEADRDFAATLHEQCYRDVVIQQFGAWDPALQQRFFEQKWRPAAYRLIVCDGEAIGLLAVEEKADHQFLAEILIHPSYQNRGMGSAILADLLNHARTQQLSVRLQVLRCNRAQALYERLGFVRYGQTDTHLLFEYRCA